MSGFIVQAAICETCIYRGDFPLDLNKLENDVRAKRRGAMGKNDFDGYRECHHTPRGSKVCCRGFWNAHKDHFALGQIAQRLGMVTFVGEQP